MVIFSSWPSLTILEKFGSIAAQIAKLSDGHPRLSRVSRISTEPICSLDGNGKNLQGSPIEIMSFMVKSKVSSRCSLQPIFVSPACRWIHPQIRGPSGMPRPDFGIRRRGSKKNNGETSQDILDMGVVPESGDIPIMYVCMYVRTYVRTYVCMYVGMYVCMYLCMHACR